MTKDQLPAFGSKVRAQVAFTDVHHASGPLSGTLVESFREGDVFIVRGAVAHSVKIDAIRSIEVR